jgi:hypothetical protein
VLGALERVAADVTLLVLVRDTPEYVGVLASTYQTLRRRGYFADSSRLPAGGQRLRIQRRREPMRPPRPDAEPAALYAPPPGGPTGPLGAADERPAAPQPLQVPPVTPAAPDPPSSGVLQVEREF